MNIIENCTFTILACTWTIQHPNLPAEGDDRVTTFLRRCRWTFLNIIAPEFLLAQAIDHRIWAIETVKYLKNRGIEVVKEASWWSSIFRWCGARKKDVKANSGGSEPKLTLKHCYYGNMGGFVVQSDLVGTSTERSDYAVTMAELVEYLNGDLGGAARISEEDIEDKDKADLFTRVIALGQILWLVFTVSTRKLRHLATSQLEVLTLAFAGCAFLTYFYYWDKPQNVKIPRKIPLQDGISLSGIRRPRRFMMRNSVSEWGLRLRNDAIRPNQDPPFDMMSLLMIAMIPVGGIHLLAWNFAFPTPAERILWRTASLLSMGLPVLLLLLIWVIPATAAKFLSRRSDGSVRDNARQFVLACITVMRDYDDEESETSGGRPFAEALEKLNGWDSGSLHYSQIFKETLSHLERLKGKIRADEGARYSVYFQDFDKQFGRLIDIIKSRGNSDAEENEEKKERTGLWRFLPGYHTDAEFRNVDRTDLFPRYTNKELSEPIRRPVLRYVFPMMAGIYSVSRVIIIALAFSSFRAMPDSVYETAWTRYIPIIQ